ncbi:hypothetical protein G7048_12030 [Diaphorobacter sp. HDW4B]|uniref:TniQ family protein n=1 Tax=Diaphorobacter sp. HDW4B TaxID=2714925 RepID=UPI00140DF2E6|nr:TniQ family protein [Diaphorobacter sp. HDW4B]QIL71023.1 hypothetical protein G7048_12030 [Diaphorobacter sp. HDW4B]
MVERAQFASVTSEACIGQFLVRPIPMSDECPVGFRARALLLNGMRWIPKASDRFETLDAERSSDDILPAWSINKAARSIYSPVCPACVAENGYFKRSWRLARVDICLQHNRSLSILSTKGGRNLSHWEILNSTEMLENLATRERSSNYEESTTDLLRQLWKWTLDLQPTTKSEDMALSIFSTELLRQLVFARRGRDFEDKLAPFWSQVAQWLYRYQIKYVNTFEGVMTLLETLPSRLHQVAALRFLEQINSEESRQPTLLSHLPIKGWLLALKTAAGPLPTQGRGALGCLVLEEPASKGLSFKATQDELQITSQKLRLVLCFAKIEPVKTIDLKRQYRLFSRDDIEHLKSIASDTLTRNEAINMLQLDHRRPITRRLRELGKLHIIRTGKHEIYRRAEISDLLHCLSKNAKPFKGHASIALNDLDLYRGEHVKAIGDMLDAISTGELDTWIDTNQAGLASIRVTTEATNWLRRRSRVRRAEAIKRSKAGCQQ